jgi:hypothetical protein
MGCRSQPKRAVRNAKRAARSAEYTPLDAKLDILNAKIADLCAKLGILDATPADHGTGVDAPAASAVTLAPRPARYEPRARRCTNLTPGVKRRLALTGGRGWRRARRRPR